VSWFPQKIGCWIVSWEVVGVARAATSLEEKILATKTLKGRRRGGDDGGAAGF